jgi:hypothetical protein
VRQESTVEELSKHVQNMVSRLGVTKIGGHLVQHEVGLEVLGS